LSYYPVLIELAKVKTLVVGGGDVALRKVCSLRDYEADVTVISPVLCTPLEKMVEKGQVAFLKRKYYKGDVLGYRLVFAATDQREVNMVIAEEAKKAGIWVNTVGNPKAGDFIVPAKVQRGDLSIFVSTNGKSPLLAKKIRSELEQNYGKEYEEFVRVLGEAREKALKEIKNPQKRQEFFSRLVYGQLIDILRYGTKEECRSFLDQIWHETK